MKIDPHTSFSDNAMSILTHLYFNYNHLSPDNLAICSVDTELHLNVFASKRLSVWQISLFDSSNTTLLTYLISTHSLIYSMLTEIH